MLYLFEMLPLVVFYILASINPPFLRGFCLFVWEIQNTFSLAS